MQFITDRQTIDDLGILGKSGNDSIYHIFNKTYTRGGAKMLEELFLEPLSSDAAINARIAVIRYFMENNTVFPFRGNRFEEAERYLADTDPRSRLSNQGFTMSDYKAIQNGVLALVDMLHQLRAFLSGIPSTTPYAAEAAEMQQLLAAKELEIVWREPAKAKLSHAAVVECDNTFRFLHRQQVEQLLLHIYRVDVYISIAQAAARHRFVFPKAVSSPVSRLHIRNVYHPLLKNAVPNSLDMDGEGNTVFLTGANMAGKSTFMKSLGIAVYLAHLGFPVAAEEMEFSVMEGICTTINLPDNLGLGASHFYAEVLRVKKVAALLKAGKRLFVIFDELFRGTNVKDAEEATVAIMEAFTRQPGSLFVISTHIIEAGETLRQKCPHLLFRYLPTHMRNNVPEYTYTLENGITDDRHGMLIINNEGVVDLISREKQPKPPRGKFLADAQTLEDLNLLGKFKPGSIYNLFNRLQTRGGEKLLEEMFKNPMTDHQLINERSRLFAFFQQQQFEFPVSRSQFESLENYLSEGAGASRFSIAMSIAGKKIRQSLFHGAELLQLQAGLSVTIEALKALNHFFRRLREADKEGLYRQQIDAATAVLAHPQMAALLGSHTGQLSLLQLTRYDYLFRHALLPRLKALLDIVYEVDVYISVAQVAASKGFVYAKALAASGNMVHISGLHHPMLKNPVRNTLGMSANSNLVFLTGANMAGKSTLMKSFGIAVYLAHMGFPVAAADMVFSVKDGLYSSINVSDNLNMGYSHFYAEVLRAKMAAEAVNKSLDLYLIFDELFKGTNVKDAYDATLAVTSAFAANNNCFFIISTHIIEVGQALKERAGPIQFVYLPTIMRGNVPHYPYTLTAGITEDRQGMLIIRNEGILEMLG